MEFLIKKFLRWIAGIPQPTLDFPPYHQNRPYIEGASWSICKVLDDGFKWEEVLRRVEEGMRENPGELSPFFRGAWNGLYAVRYGTRGWNIEYIPETGATGRFRRELPPSMTTNPTNPEITNNRQP